MAAITPNQKNGKITSYRFRACVGRDKEGKQIFRSTTWKVPDGLIPSKAERAARKAAEKWENEARAEYEKDLKDPERVKAREIARTKTDFVTFVEQDWFPVCIDNGERKPKTVSFYTDTKKNITAYFAGDTLQKMSPTDIQKFLIYLRTEKGFSPQNVHHHYRTLNMVSSFAIHKKNWDRRKTNKFCDGSFLIEDHFPLLLFLRSCGLLVVMHEETLLPTAAWPPVPSSPLPDSGPFANDRPAYKARKKSAGPSGAPRS